MSCQTALAWIAALLQALRFSSRPLAFSLSFPRQTAIPAHLFTVFFFSSPRLSVLFFFWRRTSVSPSRFLAFARLCLLASPLRLCGRPLAAVLRFSFRSFRRTRPLTRANSAQDPPLITNTPHARLAVEKEGDVGWWRM